MIDTIPIIVIDLDNTIVGNVIYQMLAHNLCEAVKDVGSKCSGGGLSRISEAYKQKNRLIRPHFCDFIRTAREYFPNIMIFVYTASEKSWATKEIQWIERNCNIQFNRPIFTRDDCVVSDSRFTKSIKNISSKLKKATKNRVDYNNILIIDNNKVFTDFENNFIKCPDYDYILIEDLWRFIPKKMLTNERMQSIITRYIEQGFMNPFPTHILDMIGRFESKNKYYKWFEIALNNIIQNNKKFQKDIFWLNLKRLIENNKYNNLLELRNDILHSKIIKN